MKLLILGGTGFLGPHIVEAAVRRKHVPTLFNRGKTHPGLFPDLEQRLGDRDPKKGDGLKSLEAGEWDAAIDTSGYVPRIVDASAKLLATRIKMYVFVSTISVYADTSKPGTDESAPVGTVDDKTIEKVGNDTYGPLKALCEQAAEAALPGRVANVRPGLIIGPGDPTDRFTYWPVRIDRGGEVLAPGDLDSPVQYIDARDLADFILKLIEDGHAGTYNAVGPLHPFPMAAMLYGCRAVTTSDSSLTWVPADFLAEQNARPFVDLPMWVPDEGFMKINSKKGVSTGLTFRPFADTARDTLAWTKTWPADHRMGAGLSSEKEQAILKAWHAKSR